MFDILRLVVTMICRVKNGHCITSNLFIVYTILHDKKKRIKRSFFIEIKLSQIHTIQIKSKTRNPRNWWITTNNQIDKL